MTSYRNGLDRRLVQLQWAWRELTWAQLLARVGAWLGVLAILVLAFWWWRRSRPPDPDLKTLQADLRSQSPNVRAHAYHVLLERDDAASCFGRALRDDRLEIRREAAAALAQYEHSTAPAVKALIDALADSDEEIRCASAIALGRAGDRADLAAPALRRTVLDPVESEAVKMYALSSLKELEKASAASRP